MCIMKSQRSEPYQRLRKKSTKVTRYSVLDPIDNSVIQQSYLLDWVPLLVCCIIDKTN